MSLAAAAEQSFSRNARGRGLEYFEDGAVKGLEATANGVRAIVSGTVDYDVALTVDGGGLMASCSCPHFLENLLNCKHIWATLLAADASQSLRVEGAAALEVIPSAPRNWKAQTTGSRDLFGERPGTPARPARQPPKRQPSRPAPPPRWRMQFGEIAASAPHRDLTNRAFDPASLLYSLLGNASNGEDLVIEIMTRERKADGEWARPRAARLPEHVIATLPPGPDRDILDRLLGASAFYAWGPFGAGREISRVRLDGIVARDLLPAMCATGRLVAALDAGPSEEPATSLTAPRARKKTPAVQYLPLAWDDRSPWRLQLDIRRNEAERAYAASAVLERDGERMAVSDPLIVSAAGILVTRSHVAAVDLGAAFGWVRVLRREPIVVPLEARGELANILAALAPPLGDVPAELQVTVEQPIPRPVLALAPVDAYGQSRYQGTLHVEYDGLRIPASVPSLLISDGSTRVVRRDLDAERRFVDVLRAEGFRLEWSTLDQARTPQIIASRLPAVIRSLLAQDWLVDVAGVQYRQPSATALHVRTGIDWFELDAHVDYDGIAGDLPALLAAAARGEDVVALPDGTMGLVPREWLRRQGLISRLGTVHGQALRFRRSQTALLDALLAAQPDATCDELFERARAELRSFDGIAPADPPASFTGTLRPYQQDGLGWLLFLRRFGFGGCLADDMGLGKTVMVLALLARVHGEPREPRRPSLVVAPRSVVFNWRREAERFVPSLRVLEYTGTGRAARRTEVAAADLVLTTYGTLRRDAAHLAEVDFAYVVLDEAQAIKNASSASAKAARVLRGSHRLALSGTPVENHLGELWSLFEFLNPGLLGGAATFEGLGRGRALDEEGVALLARGLKPFILRRTKEQVAPELPAKTEQTIFCELERPQRLLYDELRNHYRTSLLARVEASGLGRAKLQVLEALLRLRQAACHPALIDPARRTDPAAKLDVLVPQLLEVVEEGHKALVFSQFTSLLSLLREKLDAEGITYEYLDGRTRDRQSKVDRFQTDEGCRVFLISLKAGGLGLNLTAADYVFLLDPWWNPAVEAQAVDRSHRIGQTAHVFAYRLIAKDTVEERVLELQQRKKALADAILTADESLIRTLQREDLELLLS